MTFFKAIQNDKVVSVGTVFLKWNTNKNKFYICDVDEGQFVETYDEKYIFRDNWMKQAPDEATGYEYATIVIISQQEYEDLLAVLSEGETVEIEKVLPAQEEETVEPPQEEKPLSIADMREIILRQQSQIDLLLSKINDSQEGEQ